MSALLCALISAPLGAMEKPDPEKSIVQAKQQPERSRPEFRVRDYINLRSFFADLFSLLTEDTIDPKKFYRLLKFIKIENIPALFSIDKATAERYFNAAKFARFIESLEETGYYAQTENKVALLKACFNIQALETLLGCHGLDPLLSVIIELYLLNGQDMRIEKLKALRESIARCAQSVDNKNNLVAHYFDIDEIMSIIDDLIAGKVVADERILKTILCDASLKLAGCHEKVEHFIYSNKMLSLMVATFRASKAPSLKAFLSCVKWENIIVPQALENIFVLPTLRALIAKLQQGIPATRNDIIDTLNPIAIGFLVDLGGDMALEAIKEVIDFDAIANFLNNFAFDLPESREQLAQAIRLERLGSYVGLDVSNALNTRIPVQVQISKMMEFAERALSARDLRLLYSLPVLGYPIPLMLLWKAFHCQTALSSCGFLSCSVLSAAALIGVGWGIYSRPNSQAYFINAVACNLACHGLRMFTALRSTPRTDVMRHAQRGYDRHPSLPEFKKFVELLDDELDCLDSPYDVCKLLEDPFEFIDKHEQFIDACARSANGAKLMKILRKMLEMLVPVNALKMQHAFRGFTLSLTADDISALPTKKLLLIAQYRPAVLLRYSRFIVSIRERKNGNRPLLEVLDIMIRATRRPEDMIIA